MKTKLLFSIIFCVYNLSAQNTSGIIKLVGFSNQNSVTNITKWNVGSLVAESVTPVPINGILIGTSTFDAFTGNFYAKVSTINDPINNSKMLKYNVSDNSFLLSSSLTFSNSGCEVDMQNGMIYSYERTGNQYYMNKYNPTTNTSVNLGDFIFGNVVYFYPDSNCYDTNNKKYYFLIADNTNVIKLVTVDVLSNPLNVTISPLVLPSNIVGNIGLEFNNTTNEIIANYSVSATATELYGNRIGKINTVTNTLENLATITGVQGYVLGARSFDQNTQTLLFKSSYSPSLPGNSFPLVKYNMVTNVTEIINIPFNFTEFEADNYAFALAKYNNTVLNNETFNSTDFNLYPNPTFSEVNFSKPISNFTVTDLNGKILFENKNTQTEKINLGNFVSGTYFINFTNNAINNSFKILKK